MTAPTNPEALAGTAPRAVAFTFDEPGKWLNSNERIHWRERSTRVNYWRTVATYRARSAIAARLAPKLARPGEDGTVRRVHITATVCRRAAVRADAHNVQPTVKALIDGLVEGGLLPDDSDRHVAGVTFDAEYGVPRAIRLTVREEAS